VTSLLQHAAGISVTKYKKGNQVVDLTNIRMKDGMPEIVYCLMLMCTHRKNLGWWSLLTTQLQQDQNGIKNLYKFLLSKITDYLQQMESPLIHTIIELIQSSFTVSLQRDKHILKVCGDLNIKDHKPFITIDQGIIGTVPKSINLPSITCDCHINDPVIDCNTDAKQSCACCNLPSSNTLCTTCAVR